jgi:hypothetical protein
MTEERTMQYQFYWTLFLAMLFSLLAGWAIGALVATVIVKIETSMRKRQKVGRSQLFERHAVQ